MKKLSTVLNGVSDRYKRIDENSRYDQKIKMQNGHYYDMQQKYTDDYEWFDGIESVQLRKIYDMAWSFGHSSGLNEVENYFMEICDHLTKTKKWYLTPIRMSVYLDKWFEAQY